jgi:3-phenylpropionate/cinnamic acid dioxygenase small subunit
MVGTQSMTTEASSAPQLRTHAFASMNRDKSGDFASAGVELGAQLAFGSPVYCEAMDFLIRESYFLDHDRISDWFALLAEDIRYTAPVRQSVWRRDGQGFDDIVGHFDDDYASLQARVLRLDGESAWAEDPPSRVRRMVSNLIVNETADADEYVVLSSIAAFRNRWDESYDILTAEREDLVRRTDGGMKLARRRILIDQALLHTPNLAIFL